MRKGMSLMELMFVSAIGVGLLVPLMTLSSRNVTDQEDSLERDLAQGLCFDLLERLHAYGPAPASAAQASPDSHVPRPLSQLFLPFETDRAKWQQFDSAYLLRAKKLGMSVTPTVERFPDGTVDGLFKLRVTVAWSDRRGRSRQFQASRYCFVAP